MVNLGQNEIPWRTNTQEMFGMFRFQRKKSSVFLAA